MEIYARTLKYEGIEVIMKSKLPLISVVIPTYKRANLLVQAIESVLVQTYFNFEIIVVDDNAKNISDRESTSIIMQKFKEDDRIIYIQNKENLGGALTRNVGINASHGKYIAFLDDDDMYLPNNLQELLNCFINSDNPRLALVYGQVVCKGKGVNLALKAEYDGCCIFELLKNGCICATSQWMCLKEALIAVKLFPNVPSKQDSTLMLKLFEARYEIKSINQVLTIYTYHDEERISSSKKTAEGENLFRIYGRKFYTNFNQEQIKEIEYSFSKRLFIKYLKLKEIYPALKEYLAMLKVKPVCSIKFLSYELYRKIVR